MARGDLDSSDRLELEKYRSARRYDLARRAMPALYVAAFGVPVIAATPVAKALAGKNTTLGVTISITFAVSIALSAGVIALWRRVLNQKQSLRRQRRRIEELEGELKQLKKGEG